MKASGLAIAAALLMGTAVEAGTILSVTSSGSGGTVSQISFPFEGLTNVSQFVADFTANASIDITVSVDSAGMYQLVQPDHTTVRNIFNDTGSDWSGFDIKLLNAPAGSSLNAEQSAGFTFDPYFFGSPPAGVGTTELVFSESGSQVGNGLATGFNTGIGPIITVGGSGAATFDLVMTPVVGAAGPPFLLPPPSPEPSTGLLACVGAVAGLGMLKMRRR